jgi:hypothetical protein
MCLIAPSVSPILLGSSGLELTGLAGLSGG